MQKSLANSPLIPLLTAAGAAVLIIGTFSNPSTGDDKSSLASSSSSCDATLDPTCTSGGGASPGDAGAPPEAAAPGGGGAPPAASTPAGGGAAAAGKAYTLTIGKPGTVGQDTITVTKATKASATATIAKKSVTLPAGKATKAGKGTYTYKSVKGKTVTITAG